jgi:hypothetical protein
LHTAALDADPDSQLNSDLVLYADASGNYHAFVGGSKTPDDLFYTSDDPDHFATYTLNETSLVIQVAGADGSITIEDFQEGDLGIWLRDLLETPERTLLLGTEGNDFYAVIGIPFYLATTPRRLMLAGNDEVAGRGGVTNFSVATATISCTGIWYGRVAAPLTLPRTASRSSRSLT